MAHPETENRNHDQRMARADQVRQEIDDREVWEIFDRLEEIKNESDQFGQRQVIEAVKALEKALDLVSETIAR